MAILHLRWGDPDRREHVYNLVRHCHPHGYGFEDHDHDYAEVMWVEMGTYTHLLNGISEELGPGDLRCMRPTDRHNAYSHAGGGVLVNLAFPLAGLGHLARGHRAIWPWIPGSAKTSGRLDTEQLERMQRWCQDLGSTSAGVLDLECCLLDIVRILARPSAGAERQSFPIWLRQGLQVFQEDGHIGSGVPGLARLCDRSVAHLNRTVQMVKGCTASELVANLRLDWMAKALRESRLSVSDLCGRVGFCNRTHFYRLFIRRYGTTPGLYRKVSREGRLQPHQNGMSVL